MKKNKNKKQKPAQKPVMENLDDVAPEIGNGEQMASAHPFIKADVLASLMKGSHEAKIDEVASLVGENKNLFTSNDEEDVAVIATFENSVVVANSNARMYRGELGQTESEGLTIAKVEEIELPVMDESKAKEYATETVRQAVASFMESGKLDEGLVASAYAMNQLIDDDHFANKMVKSVSESIVNSEWRKFIVENKVKINDLGIERPRFVTSTAVDVDKQNGIIEDVKACVESLKRAVEIDEISESKLASVFDCQAETAVQMKESFIKQATSMIVLLDSKMNKEPKFLADIFKTLARLGEDVIVFSELLRK